MTGFTKLTSSPETWNQDFLVKYMDDIVMPVARNKVHSNASLKNPVQCYPTELGKHIAIWGIETI